MVLIDQHAIASQTSPRAAGLTTKAASTDVMTRLMDEAVDALKSFQEVMGCGVDYHESGSMKAAYTEAGTERIVRDANRARSLGIAVRDVTAAEAHELAPHFHPGDATHIIHTPSDGWMEPSKVPIGFASRAAELGVQLEPFNRVLDLTTEGDRVTGVRAVRGEYAADAVVDAAGAWTRQVAAMADIPLALVPVRHQLYITRPIAGVQPLNPIVRILEKSVYVRYANGGLMLGGYEDEPMVVDPEGQGPGFEIGKLELDLGVLRGLTNDVAEQFPALVDAEIAVHRGGIPTMTPDGLPIIGPIPALRGFYAASGCCVGGLSLSPAAGRALADLIVDGESDPDLSPLSPLRFQWQGRSEAELQAVCIDRYARKYTK